MTYITISPQSDSFENYVAKTNVAHSNILLFLKDAEIACLEKLKNIIENHNMKIRNFKQKFLIGIFAGKELSYEEEKEKYIKYCKNTPQYANYFLHYGPDLAGYYITNFNNIKHHKELQIIKRLYSLLSIIEDGIINIDAYDWQVVDKWQTKHTWIID